jgi:Curlin associated repeat
MQNQRICLCVRFTIFLTFLCFTGLLYSQNDSPNFVELKIEDSEYPELGERQYLNLNTNESQVFQIGNDNSNTIYQNGYSNEVISRQIGYTNELFIDQSGNSQTALLIQSGNNNLIDTSIDGVNNDLVIIQDGNNNNIQAEFEGIIESEIFLYQQGNQNEMDLYRSNENNMNLQILQRGSNMKVTILEY